MGKNIDINVNHITRVEGHGNIVVNVSDGTIEKCEWQVPEAPRFFESMIRGRHYSEVARITSRICGICSIGHTLASCKATEDALGIELTEQSWKLRRILKHAETFDSHVVHLLFLVAPDLLGVKSVFPLLPTHPETVKQALRLKNFGHVVGSLLAGRTTHPTRPVPGGFSSYPTLDEVKAARERLENEVVKDWDAIVQTLASVAGQIPTFDRPTEYMALHDSVEYGLYDGCIQTVMPDGSKQQWPLDDYLSVTNEFVVPTSTAKHTRNKLPSYMAGALARFNNNYDQLRPEAKAIAQTLGLQPQCHNPYMNNVAQVVEIVHSLHTVKEGLDDLIANGIEDQPLAKPTRFDSEGFGAVEVPRGILFHNYQYDKEGFCTGGNCIIPTNQNHGNIQFDFDKLVPEMLNKDMTQDEMRLHLEMLVRAYDPCISCSTHYLDVEFKE
ncbi:Ni/Fe hydrogenase subunit alpha [Dongshaea marina]|uniref:Ni/Fe hydrogenase subunit alpha n=1 Tax=Dongshaea marina TaxID=2047966 RepID=UPI000D3E9045|nr:Ni/Fe hydrogenase subunit alpha [Dongshaea marina]